jgi:hypothetical protein
VSPFSPVTRFSWCLLSNYTLLKLLDPSGSLIRCQSVQVYHHPPFPVGAGRRFESGDAPLHLWLLLCVQSLLLFQRGPTLPQCPDTHFLQSKGSPDCFAISSPTVRLKVLLSVLLFPRCIRSFTPQFLMLLLHSGHARCLFPNVCPFQIPPVTLSLPGP